MKRGSDWVFVALLAALFFSLQIPAAHAYIDPGTGSALFQAAIAGLLAGAVTIRAFWGRIRDFFASRNHEKEE